MIRHQFNFEGVFPLVAFLEQDRLGAAGNAFLQPQPPGGVVLAGALETPQPQALALSNQDGGSALGRIGNALIEGAREGLRTDDPIGLDPATVRALRQFGVFNSGDETVAQLPKSALELIARGGTALGDILLRGVAAPFTALPKGAAQTARELGASQGMARRLERDLNLFGVVGGLLTGFMPSVPLGATLAKQNVFLRELLPRARPRPGAIPGRRAVRLPRGPVNAGGRQRTSSLGEAKTVINEVFDTQESAVGKLFREDIGDIKIYFGVIGNPEKDFKGGIGLAKNICQAVPRGNGC